MNLLNMQVDIITLFPQIFEPYITTSIVGRAQKQGSIRVSLHDLRNYGIGKHKTVDDTPYGGGVGMILKVDVLASAIEQIETESKTKSHKILLDPKGKKLTQKESERLSKKKRLMVICGHYEGVDERVYNFIDEAISIGDYVLSGGEIAAMVLLDSILRLAPGVLSKKEAYEKESFAENLLEYPQYTRPKVFRELPVPQILIGGNSSKISQWRRRQQVNLTKKLRPDLFLKLKTVRKG